MRLTTVLKFAAAYLAGIATVILAISWWLSGPEQRQFRTIVSDHMPVDWGRNPAHAQTLYQDDLWEPSLTWFDRHPFMDRDGRRASLAIVPFVPKIMIGPDDVARVCIEYQADNDDILATVFLSPAKAAEVQAYIESELGPKGTIPTFGLFDYDGAAYGWTRPHAEAIDRSRTHLGGEASLGTFRLNLRGDELFQNLGRLDSIAQGTKLQFCDGERDQYEAFQDMLHSIGGSDEFVEEMLLPFAEPSSDTNAGN